MKFFLSVLLSLAGSIALTACGGGDNNNGAQVVPYAPGAPYYNCIPGQPCGGMLTLANNFSQPLYYSGHLSLDTAQSKSVIDSIQTFQKQIATGYTWSVCWGSGSGTNSSIGAISMIASQVQGPAYFHVTLALGRVTLYDRNPQCPSGATVIADAPLVATQNGGSQLQFMQFGHSFTILSDTKLDGTVAAPTGVKIIIDGHFSNPTPFGTVDFSSPAF